MTRSPRAFPPELRVRRKSEYARAFAGGVVVRDARLKLIVLRGTAGRTRLGTAVSRRAGGAIARNRVRRRLREAFRLARLLLPDGLDLVAVPVAAERDPAFADLQASLIALARKAERKLEERERKEAAS